MRLSQAPPSLVSLLLAVLSHTDSAIAGPYPKDDLHDLGFSFLMDRSCASYCGADNQYCCTTGQACYTNAANVAYCSAGATVGNTVTSTYASGGYEVYTTTYTETDLVLKTSTYTSSWAAGATGVVAICDTSLGQTSCGAICCASGQRCQYSGQCEAISSAWSYTPTSGTYSAPVRPTSGTGSTSTATVSATTTEPFIPPATASGSTLPITQDSSGSSLSGGAIAGIVIGTILGVILLLLLCFCCIVKGLWDGLLAIFGLGGGRRRKEGGVRTERIETVERYSRHGSTTAAGAAARRQEHTGWFGTSKPTRVTEVRKTKKSSGMGGLGAVGAGLLGTAVLLGLKKREDDREKRRPATVVSVTDVSSTYYTDSYTGTSASMYSHLSLLV
jgi:hypothetical protein